MPCVRVIFMWFDFLHTIQKEFGISESLCNQVCKTLELIFNKDAVIKTL